MIMVGQFKMQEKKKTEKKTHSRAYNTYRHSTASLTRLKVRDGYSIDDTATYTANVYDACVCVCEFALVSNQQLENRKHRK